VEVTTRAIQRGFFQEARGRIFYSRFEISEWCSCKVHPDCHIQVEKNFHSVPFLAVGTTVRANKNGSIGGDIWQQS
jgi:hypothetical protein